VQITFRVLRFDPTQTRHETLGVTWRQLVGGEVC
jgi:hypothetical protein